MSLESVRAFLAQTAPDIEIIEMQTSTATVTRRRKRMASAPRRSQRHCRCAWERRKLSSS